MNAPLVLDLAGLEALASSQPPPRLRALLAEALARRRDILVPAVVCAEVCRGVARTRRVEGALSRHQASTGQRPAVTIIETDLYLARQVGAVLFGTDAGSRDMVDAHVVAICVNFGGGLVITSDPEDIARLAAAVPAARIVTRPAN